MIEFTREMIAYSIIGAVVTFALPVGFVTMRRRRQEKLRRRGIKVYRH